MATEPIRIPIRQVSKEITVVGPDAELLIDDGTSMGRAKASNAIDARAAAVADGKIADLSLNTASQQPVEAFATAAQGAKADTAVQPARQIIAGSNLTGGGDLSADRTLGLDSATQTTLVKADGAVVPTRSALKALDTDTVSATYLTEEGRAGPFVWRAGDYSADVSADASEALFIAADGVSTSSGAWVRVYNGLPDVRWWGVVADGVADDTDAMQAVYDRGGSYELPFGVIRTTSPLTAHLPMTFIGQGCAPYTAIDEEGENVRGKGSWFFFDHLGVGVETIGIDPGTETSGTSKHRYVRCGSFRPQPTPSGPTFEPIDASWDFVFNDTEFDFDDYIPLNPTRYCHANLERGGRGRFSNVRGQPLLVGISVDEAYDLFEVDAHFWPFWSLHDSVKDYTLANLQSLVTGRVDGLKLGKFFTIFANVGWVISDQGEGSLNRAHGDLVYLDNCKRGIVVSPNVDGATINVNNLICYGLPDEMSYGLQVDGDNVRFTAAFADFEVHYNQSAYISGTGNRVELGAAKFKNYGFTSSGTPGCVVEDGNTFIVNGDIDDIPLAGRPLFAGAGERKGPSIRRNFTPAISATSGTIATVGTLACAYSVVGRTITLYLDITIDDIGTGSGVLVVSLPASAVALSTGSYRNLTTGTVGVVQAQGASALVVRSDNAFPVANGNRIVGTLTYART